MPRLMLSPPVQMPSTPVRAPVVGVEPAVAQLLGAEGAQLGLLADRGDDGLHRQLVGVTLDRHRAATSRVVGLAELHPLHDHGADLALVVAQDLERRRQVLDVDALLEGLLDLALDGRHLGPGAAVENGHVGAHPPRDRRRVEGHPFGDAGRVDGGVATADHHHVAADLDLLARVGVVEELGAGPDARPVLAGDAELLALVGADGDVDGVDSPSADRRR